MPTPRPDEETRAEFMRRCIPQVIEDETAADADQATAICSSMWADATKAKGIATMTNQRLNARLEIKAISAREFEGYGSVFGNVDLGGDVVMPGAMARTLAQHKANGTMPAMLWMHKLDQVPGVWRDMAEDKKGLYVRGELVDTQLGNETRTLLQKGAVRGLSIGYQTIESDFTEDGVRKLIEIELFETSIVSLAMNPLAAVEAVKTRLSRDGEYVPTAREFERSLRDAGLSRKCAMAIVAQLDLDGAGGMPGDRLRDATEVDETADQVLKALADLDRKIAAAVLKR